MPDLIVFQEVNLDLNVCLTQRCREAAAGSGEKQRQTNSNSVVSPRNFLVCFPLVAFERHEHHLWLAGKLARLQLLQHLFRTSGRSHRSSLQSSSTYSWVNSLTRLDVRHVHRRRLLLRPLPWRQISWFNVVLLVPLLLNASDVLISQVLRNSWCELE